MRRFRERPFVIVSAIGGIAFLVLGLLYLFVTAPHLPDLIGGIDRPVHHANHYTKRAVVCLFLAIGLLGFAWWESNLRRRRRRHRDVTAA